MSRELVMDLRVVDAEFREVDVASCYVDDGTVVVIIDA